MGDDWLVLLMTDWFAAFKLIEKMDRSASPKELSKNMNQQ